MTEGYGIIYIKRHPYRAHRVSWLLANGDPGDLMVLHHCDVPACVNPAHLFLGDANDNNKDMAAKGRARGCKALKSQCKRGHVYTPNTVYVTRAGKRHCIICRKITRAAKAEAKR